jgi:hypothetical protein
MTILVDRKYKKSDYTIGNLYIDGKWFCNCLEDTDRSLDDSMSELDITRIKKPHITAIPRGTYEVTLDVISPKYSKIPFYQQVCNGKVPRLLNVKGFDGILIHAGNSADHSSGCLLVGYNKSRGQVLNSKEVFKNLYKHLLDRKNKGEKITITIK